jgi:hypothetical protein
MAHARAHLPAEDRVRRHARGRRARPPISSGFTAGSIGGIMAAVTGGVGIQPVPGLFVGPTRGLRSAPGR